MHNDTQRPLGSSHRRAPGIGATSPQVRLFDELIGMRRSLTWRCRWMIEDPGAEVDAAVWQQIAAGLTEPVDIYWGAVTAMRRVKRREFRRRDHGPVVVPDDELERACSDAGGVETGVVERVAFYQMIDSLGPPPSPAARRWIAHVAAGRGSSGPMPPATRAAGARWARRVREQNLEACA